MQKQKGLQQNVLLKPLLFFLPDFQKHNIIVIILFS